MEAHAITSTLWIGSYPGPSVTLRHSFDVIVLCALERQALDTDIDVIRIPFDDAPRMPPELLQRILPVAAHISGLRGAGKRVLVTCQAGVNRSSFVAALSLMMSGAPAQDAIRLIRARRKPRNGMIPLCNPAFVQALKRYEKSQQLL